MIQKEIKERMQQESKISVTLPPLQKLPKENISDFRHTDEYKPIASKANKIKLKNPFIDQSVSV